MDDIRERLDRIERLLEEQTNRFDKIYDVILALDAYCRQGKGLENLGGRSQRF